MYIEPNTTIKLYSGIPFDNTYEHTLWFDDIAAQNTYFHGGTHPGRAKYTLANNSYQRVEKGKMRIALCADDIYDCNYLAFQNTNYGNKWFYAFIISVEYINNVTSEVVFEIDSIQTYLFDMTLEECFVEREHSETDEIGDNILPEPIDTSNIICSSYTQTNNMRKYDLIINVSRYKEGTNYVNGGMVNGLMQGMTPRRFPLDGDTPAETQQNIDAILDYLSGLIDDNHQDEVISMCMFPQYYTGNYPLFPAEVPVDPVYIPVRFGEYVPKNKKLLTYPYNFLDVDSLNNHALYRYEWFKKKESGGRLYINFLTEGTTSAQPQIALIPQDYNGDYVGGYNMTEKLVMDDFPQVGWSADSFKIWAATHSGSTAIKTVGGTASLAAGGAGLFAALGAGASATGFLAPLVAVVGGVLALSNVVNEAMVAHTMPAQERGTNSGNIDVATRRKDFYFRFMQVTEQQAKVIDDFFSMFGYACNRVKVPNRSGRLLWNYVKTNGCNIIGSAPADEIRKVAKIYDRGITFWKSALGIGQYHNADGTLIDNPPVSP